MRCSAIGNAAPAYHQRLGNRSACAQCRARGRAAARRRTAFALSVAPQFWKAGARSGGRDRCRRSSAKRAGRPAVATGKRCAAAIARVPSAAVASYRVLWREARGKHAKPANERARPKNQIVLCAAPPRTICPGAPGAAWRPPSPRVPGGNDIRVAEARGRSRDQRFRATAWRRKPIESGRRVAAGAARRRSPARAAGAARPWRALEATRQPNQSRRRPQGGIVLWGAVWPTISTAARPAGLLAVAAVHNADITSDPRARQAPVVVEV